MRIGVLAAAVLPALIAWSAAFLGWRWACRRLGLRGPDPAGAGARERAARRSLRTLVAFELFVVYPGLFLVGSTLLVVSAVAGSTRLLPDLALVVLVAGAFTLPLASAAAEVRDHARRRRTGAPERARRSLWADGPHALLPRRRAATPPDGAGPGAPGPG